GADDRRTVVSVAIPAHRSGEADREIDELGAALAQRDRLAPGWRVGGLGEAQRRAAALDPHRHRAEQRLVERVLARPEANETDRGDGGGEIVARMHIACRFAAARGAAVEIAVTARALRERDATVDETHGDGQRRVREIASRRKGELAGAGAEVAPGE